MLLTISLSPIAQIGIYVGILIILSCIAIFGTRMARKYKITTKEKNTYMLLMRTFLYVNTQVNNKYKDVIEDVLNIIVDSILLVDKYEKADDIILKKQLVLDYTEKYAKEKNITVDEEFKDLLNQLIDVALTTEIDGKKVEDIVQ